MSDNFAKITRNSNGFYTWRCSMDVDYYREGMGAGIMACLGIAVFILVFGGIKKIRVFVPEEDYSFVKGFIMSRLTGECEIRYKP